MTKVQINHKVNFNNQSTPKTVTDVQEISYKGEFRGLLFKAVGAKGGKFRGSQDAKGNIYLKKDNISSLTKSMRLAFLIN